MSKKNLYSVLIVAAICIGCFNSHAQVLSDIQNNFSAYQNKNLREKIFVHINKSFYSAGEILWFKIYCIDGSTNRTLNISKVAYLELLDNHGTATLQAKIALIDGLGNGSIFLPFSLNSGIYRVRAYTKWMENFSADYFFESQVTIVNPLKALPTEIKQASPAYDVQFFPEGGHLVDGLTSKVAFKITGTDGRGSTGSGIIINQHNDTVAHFKSLKFGLGSFVLKPSSNDVYKAIVTVNDKTYTKELPSVSRAGFVLSTVESSRKWDVYIKSTDSTAGQTIYLITHNHYAIKLAEGAQLVNGSAHFTIDKDKLSEGINFITLFNDQKQPVCERLIFKRPAGKLTINALADKPVYGNREKVNLTISTVNQNSNYISSNLSVSVFRDYGLENTNTDHIAAYFWLQADLKGYIESPDYYLDNTSAEASEALDNLMLSQGWTQFDWSEILTNKTPAFKFLPEYIGPVVGGHITDVRSKTPAKNITAYLTIHGKPDQLYIAKSDSNGKLLFNTQNFYGRHEIVVQTNSLQDSTYQIDISNPFDERRSISHIPQLSVGNDLAKVLRDNNLNMQVVNIFSADKLKEFYDPQTDSTSFYGKPDKTYLLEDYTRFTTMEEVLREYVGSIAVIKHQGKFGIKIFNVDKLLGQPLVLLDGVPLFDEDKIFKVDPLKIKKLEVVTKNYLYGPVLFNGVMSFSSYKDDRANFQIDPHAIILDYEGLQRERKFYSPVYNSESEINSTIPDFRSVLYWAPNVSTGRNGKLSLNFYTGDKSGKYIGIIEGLTADGRAGSQTFYFEVKK